MIKINPKRFLITISMLLLILSIIIAINFVPKMLYPIKYEYEINKYANKVQLDPNLILAIIKAESNFDKYAISSKGAKGLMQITDSTASWIAEQMKIDDFSVSNLFLPDANIKMGVWYFKYLVNKFGNIDLAIAAYNAGQGNVDKWLNNDEYSNKNELINIPYRETENYVRKVKDNYEKYKKLY